MLSSRRLHGSGWLVGAGVARGSIEQEAGVPVEKVISHPLYNGSSLDYDIALMKLRVPLNFSGKLLLWPAPSCSLSAREGWKSACSDPALWEKLLKRVPSLSGHLEAACPAVPCSQLCWGRRL